MMNHDVRHTGRVGAGDVVLDPRIELRPMRAAWSKDEALSQAKMALAVVDQSIEAVSQVCMQRAVSAPTSDSEAQEMEAAKLAESMASAVQQLKVLLGLPSGPQS